MPLNQNRAMRVPLGFVAIIIVPAMLQVRTKASSHGIIFFSLSFPFFVTFVLFSVYSGTML